MSRGFKGGIIDLSNGDPNKLKEGVEDQPKGEQGKEVIFLRVSPELKSVLKELAEIYTNGNINVYATELLARAIEEQLEEREKE